MSERMGQNKVKMGNGMKTKKQNQDKQDFISKIYDPGHQWRYDLWPLKLIALLFIIANFQWFNDPPISKLGIIAITESLFLIYTMLFLVLLKNRPSFKVQILDLVLDLLFIALFDYLSLSFFGYSSRIYALYLIPVIYCGYWFNWSFTLVFVTMVSVVYALLNFYIPDMRLFYTTGEKIVKLFPVAAIFYLSALALIYYKKKIQRIFIDPDQELKERAEKLEQLKESTQALLKDKIDGFIAIDEKGNITEANQLARELLGYSEEEINKINVKEIYAPGEASRIMKLLRQSPDGTINFKTCHQSKEKEKMPILLSASLVYDRELDLAEMLAKGEKFPSIMYFRDIRAEEIFDNIARDITAMPNEKALLDKIVETIARTMKSETCCVLIYNENNLRIEIFSHYGMPERLIGNEAIESYAENESLIDKVFVSGITQNVSNIDVAKKQPEEAGIKWEKAEKFSKYSRFGDYKHFLGTPLRIQGEVYGVIRVLNKYLNNKELDKQGFMAKDILLLERIAHQVSILLEKVRNKERFEAISKVGIELNAKVDVPLDDLLTIIAREVVEGMKFKACSLRLIEDDNKLRIKTYYGFKGEYKQEKFTLKIGEGISGKVATAGIIINVEDLEKEKDFTLKEHLTKEGLKSMLSIPLKHHDRIIGIINCYTGRKHKFTDQEIQVMETFAVYAAVAIRNKKRMDELMALNEIGNEMVKPIKKEELLSLILKKVKLLSGADCLCIKEYDERNGELKTARALNCKWCEKNKNYTINVREGLGAEILGQIVKKGNSRIIPDYDEIRNNLGNVPGKDFFNDVKSCALVPIKIDNKVFGIIFLDSYRYNFFSVDDLPVIETFSTQAAIALKNARFFNKLQMVTETFPRISELDVDIDKALKSIVEIAAQVLETDILVLYPYDDKHKKIKWPPIHSGDINYPDLVESDDISAEKPLSFIKRGTSHYSNRSQEDPIMSHKGSPTHKGIPGHFISREGIISSAVIILKVGQEIVGVMLIEYRTPHEFDDDERQIIEIFASYIAVAIQNVIHFSEKKAADTMNTIGKLSANFAHKIKNDIGTINLYTGDLMDETKPNSPQYLPLTRIKEKILKITKDINFLSNMSKIVYIPEKKLIHVNDLVKELKSEILPDLEMKKITLEIEIQPGLPKLEIDPTQVKMVFINLTQNSIDAMPGGGKIFLAISKSNSDLVFAWTDTGSGISPENARKIFDILWTTKENGSGLGLFYAKTIIEEHGGSISLDITHKKGAQFVIVLPISEPSDPEVK
jgi:PAS domain S-box-containing protein